MGLVMCGIVGCLSNALDEGGVRKNISMMLPYIARRGPDDSRDWVSDDVGLGLGHSRLAILDLSDKGAQPMRSRCGRFVIAFNGEIYNHLDLRREVSLAREVNWVGGADTESLVEYIATFGVKKALDNSIGMFAYAVWDSVERSLYLCRDIFGEKPLYYSLNKCSSSFYFASDSSALLTFLDHANLSDTALNSYFSVGYIQGEEGIFEGVKKLLPGTYMQVGFSSDSKLLVSEERYYSLVDQARGAKKKYFKGSFQESVELIDRKLTESVSRQLISDVPVGAFLSGGVDSSLITAIMAKIGKSQPQTFSIGFSDADYDESKHAALVAEYLDTEHFEYIVTPDDILSEIPLIADAYTEPFSDVSQIPTLLLSRFARSKVTVALTGDGADELFGGYNRHFMVPKIWRSLGKVPKPIRSLVGAGIENLPNTALDGLMRLVALISSSKIGILGEKRTKFLEALNAKDLNAVYSSALSKGKNASQHQLNSCFYKPMSNLGLPIATAFSDEELMMLADTLGYMSEDVLVKVDRAAMFSSLETRAPFLDKNLYNAAWSLPLEYKISAGKGKCVLRSLLERYVPKEISNRPKAGFSVPIGAWIRDELRTWVDEIINLDRLAQSGFLNAANVMNQWREHKSGRRSWDHQLWSVIVFQLWWERHLNER